MKHTHLSLKAFGTATGFGTLVVMLASGCTIFSSKASQFASSNKDLQSDSSLTPAPLSSLQIKHVVFARSAQPESARGGTLEAPTMLCNGIAISSTYALTAASCFADSEDGTVVPEVVQAANQNPDLALVDFDSATGKFAATVRIEKVLTQKVAKAPDTKTQAEGEAGNANQQEEKLDREALEKLFAKDFEANKPNINKCSRKLALVKFAEAAASLEDYTVSNYADRHPIADADQNNATYRKAELKNEAVKMEDLIQYMMVRVLPTQNGLAMAQTVAIPSQSSAQGLAVMAGIPNFTKGKDTNKLNIGSPVVGHLASVAGSPTVLKGIVVDMIQTQNGPVAEFATVSHCWAQLQAAMHPEGGSESLFKDMDGGPGMPQAPTPPSLPGGANTK